MAGLSSMAKDAIAVVVLAATTLMGLAVVQGYKDSGLVDNTTADRFITGMAIFGTFSTIIVLSLVGKIIIGLFRSTK